MLPPLQAKPGANGTSIVCTACREGGLDKEAGTCGSCKDKRCGSCREDASKCDSGGCTVDGFGPDDKGACTACRVADCLSCPESAAKCVVGGCKVGRPREE